jgi:predicted HicB family RNase H-like nuclease
MGKLMSKPEEYGICIRLIRQDDANLYEGRVNELPDLKVYCDTYSEAYEELVEAIETAQTMFAEQGREFPQAEPAEESFSGRVTLRMSKSLHRSVHEKALRDGVSLNQWIVEAVGCRVSPIGSPGHAIFIVSPARQSHNPHGLFIQPAAYMATIATSGGAATLLGTTGFIENNLQAASYGEAKPWRQLS